MKADFISWRPVEVKYLRRVMLKLRSRLQNCSAKGMVDND